MRSLHRWPWLCAGAIVVAVLATALWVHLEPVKPANLTESVSRSVGGASTDSTCQRTGTRWQCDIDDIEASGNASTYRVSLSDRRCWSAVRVRYSYVNPNLRRQARGCVSVGDRLRSLLS